jgi:glycosyltransferase involved in cell wall biosynthesis
MTGVVPEAAWRVLHNGINPDQYLPDPTLRAEFRKQHNLESNVVLGAACALRPGKQLEHFFEAAARLEYSHVKVVLAGGAPRTTWVEDPDYPARVIRRGKELLGERFLHLGRLDGLRAFFNGIDLCVNTSQQEAFGISVLEALACGCPVVGYPSTSVQELVLPNGGEIVEQDSIDQLTAALRRWVADPTRISAAQTGARRQATDYFDIRRIAPRLWEEYQSLMN